MKNTNASGLVERDGSGLCLFEKTSLFREYLAEREEILRHKWIESEKAGHDIGHEAALVDWIIHHRLKWRKTRAGVP